MSFFSDIYNNIINPTAKFLGAPGAAAGKAAAPAVQAAPSFFAHVADNISKTPVGGTVGAVGQSFANFERNNPYLNQPVPQNRAEARAQLLDPNSLGMQLAAGSTNGESKFAGLAGGLIKKLVKPSTVEDVTQVIGKALGQDAAKAVPKATLQKIAASKSPDEIASLVSPHIPAAPVSTAAPKAEPAATPGPQQPPATAAAPSAAPSFFQGLQNFYHGDITPEAPVHPVGGAVDKLIEALKTSKLARTALSTAQNKELKQRVAIAHSTLENGPGGRQGFFNAKGVFKGELAPNKPGTVESKLTEGDINELHTHIQQDPNLLLFQKIRAGEGLEKLFNGQIIQNSERKLLGTVFGPDVVKAIEEHLTTADKAKAFAGDLIKNVPRSLRSLGDLSATFRQGLFLTAKHPVIAFKKGGAFETQLRHFLSPQSAADYLSNLKRAPDYAEMVKLGLKIRGKGSEFYPSNFFSKLPNYKYIKNTPGIHHVAQAISATADASERAYVGYLNKLSVDTFRQLRDGLKSAGLDTPEELRGMAELINVANGHGGLGKFERSAEGLNTIFFAPRNMAARIQQLNPVWYAKLPPQARKEAIKTFLNMVAVGTTILGLAKAAGASVETDPRSTDFGKIRIGDRRYDIWGGTQQYVRFAVQLISGQTKDPTGTIAKTDRLNTATKFVRSKLSPVPGAVVDIGQGTDYVGNPVTPGSVAKGLVTPFIAQDIGNAIQQGGLAGALAASPTALGIGFQQYKPTTKTKSSSRVKAGTSVRKPRKGSAKVARGRKPRRGRTARVSVASVHRAKTPKVKKIKV